MSNPCIVTTLCRGFTPVPGVAKPQPRKRPLHQRISLVVATLGILLSAPLTWAAHTLPRNGLIMHLESTTGVQAPRGVVEYWWDQSGYGQDLRGAGQIRHINNALNGKPIIELDTPNEKLRQFRPSSLPTHGNDRTIFVLSAPSNVGAQFGYGTNKCGSRFLLQHAPEGYSGLSTGCTNSTMDAQEELPSGRWRLNTAVLSAGTLHHLLDGKLVDGRNRTFSTGKGPFLIKLTDIALNATKRQANNQKLRVAAVLVYNWALGPSEMRRVHRYLGSTYFRNAYRFGYPPNLRWTKMPAPIMKLQNTALANGQLKLDWRVSFADECGADNGWTHSRATTGNHQVRKQYRGASYPLSCWHSRASNSANFTDDLQSVRISWQPADTGTTIAGYRLFMGDRPNDYNKVVKLPKNTNNSHTLQLSPGTYYIAMSTLGNQGSESSRSGELSITVK